MINDILFKKAKRIHFIGIGGISMSGLAKILLQSGKIISGSDIKKTYITDELVRRGVQINIKHRAKAVDGADLVVYTGAISEKNVEYKRAIALGIPVLERSKLLGLISSKYTTIIAIAGTHGKTTTTAMLAKVLIDAGYNPTVHLGGEISFLDGNVRMGGKKYFVTEACEYRRSFLEIKPTYSLILNVEAEHLDTYKTFTNVKKAFKQFVMNTRELVVYNKNYILDTGRPFLSFDLDKPSDFFVKNLRIKNGCYLFDVYKKEIFFKSFELGVVGKHNVLNALAVITICDALGVDKNIICNSLKSFTGVRRRFEKLGKFNNAEVVIDYAHHPTEIMKLIEAVRGYYDGELVVIFQPHTYSRTAMAFDEFVNVLGQNAIDKLILLPTYSARETQKEGKTSLDLFKALRLRCDVEYHTKASIYHTLNHLSMCNTLLLFVGAGNIEDIARKLIN